MALTKKNWTLNSYTDATWTDLVPEPATVSTFVISNTSAGSITVQARVQDGGTGLATLIPGLAVAAGDYVVIDARSFIVTGTQTLQVQADVTGAEFYASGVV